jgi:hypothetical protein
MSNLQEYLAGTDPQDPSSALRFESVNVVLASNTVELVFNAMAFRTYTIEYTDQPNLMVWTRLADIGAAPTNHLVRLQTSAPGPGRFYRIVTPGTSVPHSPPRLESPRVSQSGGSLTFTFEAAANQAYVLEYTDQLGSAGWAQFSRYAACPTNRVIQCAPAASVPRRFFRLRASP